MASTNKCLDFRRWEGSDREGSFHAPGGSSLFQFVIAKPVRCGTVAALWQSVLDCL